LTVEIEDSEFGVTITLTEGDTGNLLSLANVRELHRLLDEADAASKRWVVFRHRGKDFCTGRATGPSETSPGPTLLGLVERLRSLEGVTTIGVTDGGCAGFGVGLFALTDISIATERAWFRFPEITHGIAPAIVATWLFDLVPFKQGLYWISTGEVVGAEAAHQFGLVTRLVESSTLDETVAGEIDRLGELSAKALRDAKSVAKAMVSTSRDPAVRRSVALKWFG
jgi:enoyl-CoA hydratase/carnithine racemase